MTHHQFRFTEEIRNRLETVPTPFFLCREEPVETRFTQLEKILKINKLRIFYAVKANYQPHLLKQLLRLGAGVDTVSPAEVLLAEKCGFPKERILFTGNSLSPEELQEIQSRKILCNMGSLGELRFYGGIAPNTDIVLRINTGIGSGENEKIVTCGSTTKFGINPEDIPEAIDTARQYRLRVIGLHKHSGSGITNLSAYLESVARLCALADPVRFPELKILNFGGGLTVPYRTDEREYITEEFAEKFRRIVEPAQNRYANPLEIILEPGKYLSSESAYLIVRARLIKKNGSRNIVGTDSGFTHLIRPVLYKAYHEIRNISNPDGKMTKYDITGNLCETGDRFAMDREIPEIREGDLLAICNAGAYGRAMAGIYNLRPLPAEWLLKDQDLRPLTRALSPQEQIDRILQESL